MSEMNLNNEHPDFAATQALRTIGEDLYAGSAAVKAKTTTYLTQGGNEEDAKYLLRLARAVFPSIIGKIITARQSLLFRKQHTRELPPGLDKYVDDVDMKGTPATVFFRESAEFAQSSGIRWILIDYPQTPEGGYSNKAEEKRARVRPFFEQVPASCGIDWQVGADLRLDWAVIKESIQQPRTAPGQPIKCVYRWKVWTRTEWAVYETNSGEGLAHSYAKVAGGANRIGIVPLVPMIGIKRTDFSGYPVCSPVFDHVLAIYRKWSEMDWNEHLCGLPIPYQWGPQPIEKISVLDGLYLKTEIGGAPVGMAYLEPSGAGIAAMRQTIADLKHDIYEIALAQARQDSKQVQAADSQREDRMIFAASLMEASRQYESAERRCWEIAALWEKITGDINVEYSRDFDDHTIQETMITALISMRDAGLITDETVLDTAIQGELVQVEDRDEELKKARKQADERESTRTAATMAALNTPNVPESTEGDG